MSDEEENHYESMDSAEEASKEEDAFPPPIHSEVAKERTDPQGMALFKNSTGYSDAAKSLSVFVQKTEGENLKPEDIPKKSLTFLTLSHAVDEMVKRYWSQSNPQQGEELIRINRVQRAENLTKNETMRRVKNFLVRSTIELRNLYPNESQYVASLFREEFPVEQCSGFLKTGIELLLSQRQTDTIGDPLKERTLKLVSELNGAKNPFISMDDLDKLLMAYFDDVSAMTEKQGSSFYEEFYAMMSKNTMSNGYRLFAVVLREMGIINEGVTPTATEQPRVLAILQNMQERILTDRVIIQRVNEIYRTPGKFKRPSEVPSQSPLDSRPNKNSRDAAEKKTTPDCWVCGRTHNGMCAWFNHPLKGSCHIKWIESEGGKRASQDINNVGWQLFKGAKVLNPRKGWDGKKIIDLSTEEMNKLKSSTEAKKTPSGSGKGKIAEMLLNVSEVKRHDIITDPSTEISTKPLTHEQEQIERQLSNVNFTSCQIFCDKHDVQKTSTKFLPDPGSLSEKLSGNYISKEIEEMLVGLYGVKIYKDESYTQLLLPTKYGTLPQVRKHVYFYLEYKSRTEPRVLRACIKAYIIDDLKIPILIGKQDLLGNNWIESKHLHGYDATIARMTNSDPLIHRWLQETYGTYDMDRDNQPIETLARKSTGNLMDQQKAEMIFNLSEKINKHIEEDIAYPIVDPEQRSEDEHNRYYEDADEDECYQEGELPTNVQDSPNGITKINEMLHNMKGVFSKDLSRIPAKVKPFRLDIDVEKWESLRQPNGYRRQSDAKEKAMREYINSYLGTLFKISEASQASQVNMVPKPEPGEYRFTCDFRALNDCCRKIDFQLPKIWDIITRIGKTGANHFAKIDLTQGFHQVPLHEESQRYTSFRTCLGNYEYLRMAMGTKGAPQYFQRIMIDMLQDCTDICEVYIDDILIFGKSEDELIRNTDKILKRLRDHSITVNPKS